MEGDYLGLSFERRIPYQQNAPIKNKTANTYVSTSSEINM